MTTNAKGLWMSSFQQGTISELPVSYPGDGNFAMFLATDIGTLFIAPRPSVGSTTPVWSAVGAGAYVAVPDATAYTVPTTDSGKTHVMPDLTASATITLPAPTLGREFSFIYKGVAADASSWVFITPGNTNFFLGGLVGLDADAGSAGDEVIPAHPNGSSNSKLTVATPDVGTRITFIGDGTHYIVSGQVVSAAAPVFADQP